MTDRVAYNEPGDWTGPDYALGLVDEIVLSDAAVHFEMSTGSSGYLHVRNGHRAVFARVTARRHRGTVVLCVEIEEDDERRGG